MSKEFSRIFLLFSTFILYFIFFKNIITDFSSLYGWVTFLCKLFSAFCFLLSFITFYYCFEFSLKISLHCCKHQKTIFTSHNNFFSTKRERETFPSDSHDNWYHSGLKFTEIILTYQRLDFPRFPTIFQWTHEHVWKIFHFSPQRTMMMMKLFLFSSRLLFEGTAKRGTKECVKRPTRLKLRNN